MKTKLLTIALLILGTHIAQANTGELQKTVQIVFDISELNGDINQVNSMSAAATRDMERITQFTGGQIHVCRSEFLKAKTIWKLNSHYVEFAVRCSDSNSMVVFLSDLSALSEAKQNIFELPQYRHSIQVLLESNKRK